MSALVTPESDASFCLPTSEQQILEPLQIKIKPNNLQPSAFDVIAGSSSLDNFWTGDLSKSASCTDQYQFPSLHSEVVEPKSSVSASSPKRPSVTTTESCRRLRSGNHIPRPRNAFILFRTEFWTHKKITKAVEHDHRHISRIIGYCWKELPEDEKERWRRKADEEKREHALKYPEYRFAPTARSKKPAKRKVKRNGHEELLRCKKVAQLLLEGKAGEELQHAVENLNEKEPRTDTTSTGSAPFQLSSESPGSSSLHSPIAEQQVTTPKASHCTQPSVMPYDTWCMDPAILGPSINYDPFDVGKMTTEDAALQSAIHNQNLDFSVLSSLSYADYFPASSASTSPYISTAALDALLWDPCNVGNFPIPDSV